MKNILFWPAKWGPGGDGKGPFLSSPADTHSRIARSKKIKLKRPNLAISSFKKGQILKNEKKGKIKSKFSKKFC